MAVRNDLGRYDFALWRRMAHMISCDPFQSYSNMPSDGSKVFTKEKVQTFSLYKVTWAHKQSRDFFLDNKLQEVVEKMWFLCCASSVRVCE